MTQDLLFPTSRTQCVERRHGAETSWEVVIVGSVSKVVS